MNSEKVAKDTEQANRLEKPSSEKAVDSAIELQNLAEEVKVFSEARLSDATRRAYEGHWRRFQKFIKKHKLDGEPGNADIEGEVALYLTSLAKKGQKMTTVKQALSAIALAHSSKGLPSPSRSDNIKGLLQGMRNSLLGTVVKKKALEIEDLKKMCDACLPTPKGRRDKVILLFGFLGAFRRGELSSIYYHHVESIDGGIRVLLPRSKTDQEGKGRYVTIPKGKDPRYCPIVALVDWLRVSAIRTGALFRRTYPSGKIGSCSLSAGVIGTIVKHYADEVGLDIEEFGGHSLRAGFVTAAAKNGAKDWQIMQTTGHKSASTLHGYIRPLKTLEDNPAKDFKL